MLYRIPVCLLLLLTLSPSHASADVPLPGGESFTHSLLPSNSFARREILDRAVFGKSNHSGLSNKFDEMEKELSLEVPPAYLGVEEREKRIINAVPPDRLKAAVDATRFLNTGHAYKKLGDYKKALRAYEQAVTLCPTDSLIHFGKAEAEFRLRNFKKAIVDYNQGISCDSCDLKNSIKHHWMDYEKLAFANMYEKNLTDAAKIFGMLYEEYSVRNSVFGIDFKGHLTRAEALLKTGNSSRASREFVKAIRYKEYLQKLPPSYGSSLEQRVDDLEWQIQHR